MDGLILEYKLFLQEKKINNHSVKNYLVDARKFIEWFSLYAKTHNLPVSNTSLSFFRLINTTVISEYKSFLTNNETPVKTINRRLSGVRKLLSFALSKDLINQNPALEVANVGVKSEKTNNKEEWVESTIEKFKKDLIKDKVSKNTIKNYISDTNHFLLFIQQLG